MAKKIFQSGSGRTSYPSDVTDDEWAFWAPYLTLLKEDAAQREHSLRAVFNGPALHGPLGLSVADDPP